MSHLAPCPSCNRHVRIEEMMCPFCAIVLPPELRATPAPAPLQRRLSRAALLAAGATLMGAAACSDTEGTADAATDHGAVTDGLAEGPTTGTGGSGGGSPGVDAGAGAGGSTSIPDGSVVALYGVPAPVDGGGVPIYGSPSPNTKPQT
jgi:hypothetical protein